MIADKMLANDLEGRFRINISDEEWEERRKIERNFISSIENHSNYYMENEEIDMGLAEKGDTDE